MDDVADVDLDDVAVVVLDLELTGGADPDGAADEIAVRPLDADTTAQCRKPLPILVDDTVEVGAAAIELGQEGGEQLAPVDGMTRLEVAGRRGLGELGRERSPLDVDAGAHDDGVAVTLGQDPDQFAITDHEVVRPLEPGGEPGDARDCVDHGDTAGHRDEWRVLRRERRPQEDGHEERRLRRRNPSPTPAATPGGLEVGNRHETGGRTPPRLVEQVTVRRIEGIEPANLVRTFDRLALGHRP